MQEALTLVDYKSGTTGRLSFISPIANPVPSPPGDRQNKGLVELHARSGLARVNVPDVCLPTALVFSECSDRQQLPGSPSRSTLRPELYRQAQAHPVVRAREAAALLGMATIGGGHRHGGEEPIRCDLFLRLPGFDLS